MNSSPQQQVQRVRQSQVRRDQISLTGRQLFLPNNPIVTIVTTLSPTAGTLVSLLFTVVVLLSIGVNLWLRLQLNFNGLYTDEADYLFVGRLLWLGVDWSTQTYMFSSNLPIYILGLGDLIGGTLGGRAVSAVCGLFSLYCFYHCILMLFQDRRVAFLSMLLLGLQASHIFISKFATYDGVSLALFSVSLWLFSIACLRQERSPNRPALLAAGAFFLAVMSKYVVLAYFPFLVVTAFFLRRQVILPFALPVVGLITLYVLHYRAALTILYHQQILGTHAANATYGDIVTIALMYLALPGAMWLWTFFYRFTNRGKDHSQPRILIVLFALSLPLIIYHLKLRDMISMYKHLVYACFFLCPAGGILLRDLLRSTAFPRIGVIVASGLLLVTTAQGAYYVKEMQRAYPDSSSVVAYLLPNVKADTTILSEDPYLFRYQFLSTKPHNGIYEMTWFDNDADRTHEARDVISAVWDGKFDYVYLNGLVASNLSELLRTAVLSHSYDKILEIPFSTSPVMSTITTGSLTLYKSRVPYSGPYPVER